MSTSRGSSGRCLAFMSPSDMDHRTTPSLRLQVMINCSEVAEDIFSILAMVPSSAVHGIAIDCLLRRSIVCTELSKPKLNEHFNPSAILIQVTFITASACRARILCCVSVCQFTHWADQAL